MFLLNSKSRFIKFIVKWWGNREFLLLLFFNLMSNITSLQLYFDLRSLFLLFCVSALAATLEHQFCRLFRNKVLHNCVFWLILAIHLFAALIDFFLIANFQMVFTIDTLGIISETTPTEMESFFSTYLSVGSLSLIIVSTIMIIWLNLWIARKLTGNQSVAFFSMTLTLFAVCVYGLIAYNHLVTGEGGMSEIQLHSFSRLAHACVGFKNSQRDFQRLRDVNRDVTAKLELLESPTIILVLGESFSLYHSSLYGYSKLTNPLLAKRVNDGSMVLFDDVVSMYDHTASVMRSVFSVNGSSEPNAQEVMFPTCFRKAGYKTVLIDNQYIVNRGYTWITDEKLSSIMFDFRNNETVGYDEFLFSEIPDFSDPQLIILHLFGQHYTYSKRYPPSFNHFSASDYSDKLTESEREIIAHYDNATLYNDFVVDSVIKKYEDKNCIIVYLSDHGQEIYEIDDFMGHGNAIKRPTIRYQIRVPMMVWTSPKFQSLYPDVDTRIKTAGHKPIITDNLPHFLFEVSKLRTKYYCPELSFINDMYQINKHRIVLGNVDYDSYVEYPNFKPRY